MNRLTRQWWFWIVIVTASIMTLLAALLRKLFPAPPKIVARQSQPGEHLVVLFGDSITEGVSSSNYVEILAERMGREGYRFLNAGVGGDTAYNLSRRLQPIIESQPESIVILVGTNDLQAYLRGGHLSALNQRLKKLPQVVTLEWYSNIVREIGQTLQRETRAHIALCSIPPLGEDLGSLPNQRVRLFNQTIKALADDLSIDYLPIYESMEQFLRTRQQHPGQTFEEAKAAKLILNSLWNYNIRGRKWDDISAKSGLLLQTDTIHFNRRGAELIADVIEGWLRK